MRHHREEFEEIVRRLRSDDTDTLEAVKQEIRKVIAPAERDESAPEPGRDWYIVRVELTSGRGEDFDPSPGRDLLISPQHTFRQLAEVINRCFSRWDLGHLYVFRFSDGTTVGTVTEDLPFRDAARTKIAKLREGEVFEYEFDFGDGWLHRCTILEAGVEPESVYGVRPKGPVAIWGWGAIPDQYGRTTPDG